MFTTRNLRILVATSCALALGALPALAQEPTTPPPLPVADPAPIEPAAEPVPQTQQLSVASPGRNIEATFFMGGLVGGDIMNVLSGDFSLSSTFENGRTYGGRIGYYTFPLGVEGSFTHSKSGLAASLDIADANIDVAARVMYWEANALLFILPGPVQPFITGGGGMHSYKIDDLSGLDLRQWGWNFGGGLKINIDRVSLRADVRDHLTRFDAASLNISDELADLLGVNQTSLHNVEITFGVGIAF